MKDDVQIKTEKNVETNRIRVIVGPGPDRIVDGWLDTKDSRKLDDILNSKLEYQEKIDAIKALVETSESHEAATYEKDR